MSNWLIYAPFSKQSFWGKLTDQLNRTNIPCLVEKKNEYYYLSVNERNEAELKTGVYIQHWNKVDTQFMLHLDETKQELIVSQPLSRHTPDNPFQKEIYTDKLKEYLDHYEWVAFGYISTPVGVDRYTAMKNSVYFSRNSNNDFVFVETGQTETQEAYQVIQTWFIATKVSPELYIIFCHPDILIPNFGLDYQIDKFGDTFYTYHFESFDFFEIALKPKAVNAKIINDAIYSTDEFIELKWSKDSYLETGTEIDQVIIKPTEIITDLPYEFTESGIRIKNIKGIVTFKYKLPCLVNPEMMVKKTGIIEKDYLILGA